MSKKNLTKPSRRLKRRFPPHRWDFISLTKDRLYLRQHDYCSKEISSIHRFICEINFDDIIRADRETSWSKPFKVKCLRPSPKSGINFLNYLCNESCSSSKFWPKMLRKDERRETIGRCNSKIERTLSQIVNASN